MLNQGFNYKDRRKEEGVSTSDPAEISRRLQNAVRHKFRIIKYRQKLETAIKLKDPFLIENILDQISNDPGGDEAELHHNLRMEIIKSQLCV
jgi:hypothetical protein|tara:strand:+ start:599 stop:874 length:276 start_codon:yes stop_codon:yes gene_type:complete